MLLIVVSPRLTSDVGTGVESASGITDVVLLMGCKDSTHGVKTTCKKILKSEGLMTTLAKQDEVCSENCFVFYAGCCISFSLIDTHLRVTRSSEHEHIPLRMIIFAFELYV